MNTRAQLHATPRTIFFFVAACALVFVLPRAGAAKNRRGIVPLATTRAEVERMLGRPARETWERLSYTHRKEHVRAVEEAKRPETRARRIEKSISMLAAGKKEFRQ